MSKPRAGGEGGSEYPVALEKNTFRHRDGLFSNNDRHREHHGRLRTVTKARKPRIFRQGMASISSRVPSFCCIAESIRSYLVESRRRGHEKSTVFVEDKAAICRGRTRRCKTCLPRETRERSLSLIIRALVNNAMSLAILPCTRTARRQERETRRFAVPLSCFPPRPSSLHVFDLFLR